MFFKKAPKEISLYYYKCANLGDILNETLIENLFNINVKEESFTQSDMIAIGSVLERIVKGSITGKHDKELQEKANKTKPIYIWGTGMMHGYDDYSQMEFVRPVKIKALRGELSRKAAEKITGKKINCAVGDPGILAPFMLKKLPPKKYALGIIPHVVEKDMPEYVAIKNRVENSVIIDLTGEPQNVLEQIASCECVISTSLHGLIIADGFNIPSKWCKMTDKILGNGYKYKDYYSAYGITENAFDLSGGDFPKIEEIKSNYKIKKEDVKNIQINLIKSFPYQNKYTRQLLKTLKHKSDF